MNEQLQLDITPIAYTCLPCKRLMEFNPMFGDMECPKCGSFILPEECARSSNAKSS